MQLSPLGLLGVLVGCASSEPVCPGLPESLESDWGVVPDGLDTDAFDDEVVDAMRRGCIPAVSVSVVDADGLVMSAAWGVTNVDDPRPVSVETPFMVASTSKAVDALAFLVAEEEGALSRTDPVSRHVGFEVRNHRLGSDTPVRLEHLLTHSSGIQDNWEQVLDDSYAPGDPTETLKDFSRAYLTPEGRYFHRSGNFYGWPVGREWLYSNVGVALSALAVQEATGVPFDDYCEDRLFAPLGMTNSGWFLADFDDLDAIARPHRPDGDDWVVLEHYGYPTWPDGQLRSTPTDLAQVLRVALAKGEVDGTRIVSESAVESLSTELIDGLDDWYIDPYLDQQNLLWFGKHIEDRYIVGHDGDDDGVTSEMFFDPATGVGVSVLANVADGGLGHPTREATLWLQQRLFAIGEGQR